MNEYIGDIANADPSDDRPLEQLIVAIAEIAPDLNIEVTDIGYDAAEETAWMTLYSPRTGRMRFNLPTTRDELAASLRDYAA